MRRYRHFVIAPSVARLIRKDRGGERVVEGYFPDQPDRRTYVQLEENHSSLILEDRAGGTSEQRADLPPAHAQVLLAVSQGHVDYLRTNLSIGSRRIQALHFVRPGPLDLIAVASTSKGEQDFSPLPWFGPEVSADPAYGRRRLALDGAPDVPTVDLTDAALNSVLDLLEDRLTTWPVTRRAQVPDAQAAAGPRGLNTPAPVPEPTADEGIDDLGVEDEVIRELARSLRPRQS